MSRLPRISKSSLPYGTLFQTKDFSLENFALDPIEYMIELTQSRYVSLIHKTDRSMVYELTVDPFGNSGRLAVKRVSGSTKYEVMWGTSTRERRRKLHQRVKNEIYSARRAFNRGVGTNAPYFLGGLLGRRDAWLIYKYLGEGIFMDNYLYTRDSFSHRISIEDVLRALAFQLARLHGKSSERGILHGDINTGNVFLGLEELELPPRCRGEGCDILFTDWELFGPNQPARYLSKKERMAELHGLVSEERNLYNLARLTKDEFWCVMEVYNKVTGIK